MVRGDSEARSTRWTLTNTMRGARPLGRRPVLLAVVIALLLGVMGGGLVGYLSRGPVPGPEGARTAYLNLTIGFDFATGLDRYFPANFTVPSRVLVVITVTNYDNASNPVDNVSARVSGTVGNVETVRSSSQAVGMDMAAIPAGQVAHTFTLDVGGYSMNVPIPASNSLADPMLVTFDAYFNVTGAFGWHCKAPCDPVSMETVGYMRGTITVVDG